MESLLPAHDSTDRYDNDMNNDSCTSVCQVILKSKALVRCDI